MMKRGRLPSFNLTAKRRVDRAYRLQQWSAELGQWVTLACYQTVDWNVLDRRASIGTGADLRVVDQAGGVLGCWTDGVRVQTERSGA